MKNSYKIAKNRKNQDGDQYCWVVISWLSKKREIWLFLIKEIAEKSEKKIRMVHILYLPSGTVSRVHVRVLP